MGIRMEEYVLIEDFQYTPLGTYDTKVLPAGSFVKPISERWLPQHVKDEMRWYDPQVEVYCYTRVGMVKLPWSKLRVC